MTAAAAAACISTTSTAATSLASTANNKRLKFDFYLPESYSSDDEDVADSATIKISEVSGDADVACDDRRRWWSDLPELIVVRILYHLPSAAAAISFAAVCRSWRSITLSAIRDDVTLPPPPLLLRPSRRRLPTAAAFTLLSPAGAEDIRISPASISPAAAAAGDLISYSDGFLVFSNSVYLFLINVFSGREIRPPPPRLQSHVSYALLTSAPDRHLFLFCYGGALLHWKIGESNWSQNHIISENSREAVIQHAIVVRERSKLYALDHKLRIFTIEFSHELIVKQLEVPGTEDLYHPFVSGNYNCRLIELRGEITMLWHKLGEQVLSSGVQLYRLDLSRIWPQWVKVESLGDCCLFIDVEGKSPFVCFDPNRWGGKNNYVYVTGPGCNRWIDFPLAGPPESPDKVNMQVEPVVDNEVVPDRILCDRWLSPIWVAPISTR